MGKQISSRIQFSSEIRSRCMYVYNDDFNSVTLLYILNSRSLSKKTIATNNTINLNDLLKQITLYIFTMCFQCLWTFQVIKKITTVLYRRLLQAQPPFSISLEPSSITTVPPHPTVSNGHKATMVCMSIYLFTLCFRTF